MGLLKDKSAVYFVLIYFLSIATRYLFDKINIHDEKGLISIVIICIILFPIYYFVSNKLFAYVFVKAPKANIPKPAVLLPNVVLGVMVLLFCLLYCHIEYGLKPFNSKLINYLPQTIVLAYAEEIVFRKYLISLLLNYSKKWIAIIISSLFFALVHYPYGAQRVLIAFSLGLLFGYFYTRTKTVAGTSTAHILWNLMVQNSYGVF